MATKQRQTSQRQVNNVSQGTRAIVMGADWASDNIKAAIILFCSLLDEKQRRLFAGLEAIRFGHRRDSRIAELLGLDPHTVAKGRTQLLERDIQWQSIRELGAGRPEIKKTPEVIAQIERLLEHDIAGDPMSGLKWSRRTTGKIARELQALGIEVSPSTVSRLLKEMGFSLKVNRKSISHSTSPYRNGQFEYIAYQRENFACEGNPIISVYPKKKVQVGQFKKNGSSWERE